jgi:hypothetical protein
MKLLKSLSFIATGLVVLFVSLLIFSTTDFYRCEIETGGEERCERQLRAQVYADNEVKKFKALTGKDMGLEDYEKAWKAIE